MSYVHIYCLETFEPFESGEAQTTVKQQLFINFTTVQQYELLLLRIMNKIICQLKRQFFHAEQKWCMNTPKNGKQLHRHGNSNLE